VHTAVLHQITCPDSGHFANPGSARSQWFVWYSVSVV